MSLPGEDAESLVDARAGTPVVWISGKGRRESVKLPGPHARAGEETQVKIARGAVVLVQLNPTIGHEQQRVRPCVVVSNPDVASDQRFRLLCIAPITGAGGERFVAEHRRDSIGQMERGFLRHIRVQSLDELKPRIRKGIAEINAAPVVY